MKHQQLFLNRRFINQIHAYTHPLIFGFGIWAFGFGICGNPDGNFLNYQTVSIFFYGTEFVFLLGTKNHIIEIEIEI
jgi:hypothetical protein